MMALISIMSLASGVVVALYAEKLHAFRAKAEFCGGSLLVLGLALIGAGLPLFR